MFTITTIACSIHVPVCLLEPLFAVERDGSAGDIYFDSAVRWAAAGLLAVEHVNQRNCSILGESCESLLPTLSPSVGKHLVHTRMNASLGHCQPLRLIFLAE